MNAEWTSPVSSKVPVRHDEDIEVSAIIPCLDEVETLGLCIDKIQAVFAEAGVKGEIVVGDNGSTDGSVDLALEFGARVAHERRRGYGAALQAAAGAARGRYLVMADADDSYDWSTLLDFVEPLRNGADLVMGNRFLGGIEPGAMPRLHRYLGNPVLSFLSRKLYSIPIGDFHCGMRGFTKEAYERMQVRATGMEFATEMVVRAAWAGLRIKEIPTKLYPDKRSRPPHLRSFRDGWRHLRLMLTYAPNWVYFLPGLVLFVSGLSLCSFLAAGPRTVGGLFFGPHYVALGALSALLGFNISALGVLARVAIWKEMPAIQDSLVRNLIKRYRLDHALIIGVVPLIVGLGVDFYLLYRRLIATGAMEDTVHVGFFATTLVVLGFSTIFFGFLLQILIEPVRVE